MQTKQSKTLLSWVRGRFFRIALIAVMALCIIGCGGNRDKAADAAAGGDAAAGSGSATGSDAAAAGETDALAEVETLGEGGKRFLFSVADQEGNEARFEIRTDKETVGEALIELGMIAGEDGPYGLYVTTVNGITIDFDKDGKYWAFYVGGEYALTGVDAAGIVEGESYSFRAE